MKPERAPDVLDPREVVARYRRIVGIDQDLTERLHNEPLTPLVLLAGLGDSALLIAIPFAIALIGKREGLDLYGDRAVYGFVLALCAGIGFLIANSGDDYKLAGGRRISKPLGIFTGLILRRRMRRRRAVRALEPFHADDPRVLGPVAQELAAPLLARAAAILVPPDEPPSEDGRMSVLIRLGGDERTLNEAGERIRASRQRLRETIEAVRRYIGDPSGRPALARALADLDGAIREAESARDTGETIAQNVRRAFPFAPGLGTGSLDAPIRLNEPA